MKAKKSSAGSEIKRVGKFGIVGIINTLIDFVIYNFFSSAIGLTLVFSNIISTTCAMIFSFFANKEVVFKKTNGSMLRQAAIFFAFTAFGLYVLQTGTIKFLTDIWTWPIDIALAAFHLIGIKGHDAFLTKNIAKAAGTVVSLTWNYLTYKKVVFR